jgi:hypothetical protein
MREKVPGRPVPSKSQWKRLERSIRTPLDPLPHLEAPQNDSGQVWQWLMNGSLVTASNGVGDPGSPWHVAGTSDFNSDGKADITQNDSDQIWQWLMNGNRIVSSNDLGNAANPGLHVTAQG